MWFMFGFITLLSFSIYAGYKRINAAWKGEAGDVNHIGHQYKILRNKYGITGLLVGIDAPPGYDFSLKQEAWYDRLAKFLGLSAEHQSGNQTFDELVYIVSDDRQFQRQISANAALSATVMEIFSLVVTFNGKPKAVRCNSGRLWVKISAGKGFEESQINELSNRVGKLLKAFTAQLLPLPPSPGRWRDPFVFKAAVLLAISTGFAINGAAHLLRLSWGNLPYTLDCSRLFTNAFFCGAVIVALLVVAAFVLLGRCARTHLVLIELCIVGLFGATATAFVELRDMNMELDQSPAVEYQTKILHKHISRSRRSTCYNLCLQDWTKEDEKTQIKVSSDLYDQVAVGEILSVKQKDGYFHYRWVESIDRRGW